MVGTGNLEVDGVSEFQFGHAIGGCLPSMDDQANAPSQHDRPYVRWVEKQSDPDRVSTTGVKESAMTYFPA